MVLVIVVFVGVFLVVSLIVGETVQLMLIVIMVGCVESDGWGGFTLVCVVEFQVLLERMLDVLLVDVLFGMKILKFVGIFDEFSVFVYEGKKVWVKGLLNLGELFDLLNVISIIQLVVICE